MEEFKKKLESLINECSMENGSNTPDRILATYLTGCLQAWNTAVRQREAWHGKDIAPDTPEEKKSCS